MHRLAIGTVLERIELKQCEIKQLSERITELNLKLEVYYKTIQTNKWNHFYLLIGYWVTSNWWLNLMGTRK
jgi:hypothetical protein